MTVKTFLYVDNEIKYTEEYTIGNNADFETIDDLKDSLDELIGVVIDKYEIQYEAWVMMNSENDVITDEYDTPDEAINELKGHYTIDEMYEAGFTCNKLLCDGKCWLECLDEIEY